MAKQCCDTLSSHEFSVSDHEIVIYPGNVMGPMSIKAIVPILIGIIGFVMVIKHTFIGDYPDVVLGLGMCAVFAIAMYLRYYAILDNKDKK